MLYRLNRAAVSDLLSSSRRNPHWDLIGETVGGCCWGKGMGDGGWGMGRGRAGTGASFWSRRRTRESVPNGSVRLPLEFPAGHEGEGFYFPNDV